MWSSHCFGLFYQWTSWPVMCVILQKLSLPLATPLLSTFFFPSSALSLLLAIHLSFLSLLWITGTVRWESCPNTFVLPKHSITDSHSSALFWFMCLSGRLRRSHGEVTRGPAGQLVLIASRGLFFSGGRLVSLAAQMWGEQGISPQETSKLRPTGETDGRHRHRHIQAILTHNGAFYFTQIQVADTHLFKPQSLNRSSIL